MSTYKRRLSSGPFLRLGFAPCARVARGLYVVFFVFAGDGDDSEDTVWCWSESCVVFCRPVIEGMLPVDGSLIVNLCGGISGSGEGECTVWPSGGS